MARVVTTRWVDDRTAGAPAVLRARAARFLTAASPGGGEAERLAEAGAAALRAAVAGGATRDAALDLLAADALITLALLYQAEHGPAALGQAAAALRRAAMERT